MKNKDTYSILIDLLDKNHAHYRLIDHPEEGKTEIVSKYRGNKLSQAAKCMVLTVNVSKTETKYVLGVIPGDRQIDFNAVKTLMHASYVSFAPQEITEELAQSVVGTVLPFSFNTKLELIVDPSLLTNDELFFNAARLDRSMALKTKDYVAIVKPRLAEIAKSLNVPIEKVVGVDNLDNLRHSCAHLLAAAVIELWPKAKRTIGPSIENGFYYDFDFGNDKVSEDDFPRIEAKMYEILSSWKNFARQEVNVNEAKTEFKNNKYKLELIDEFSKEGKKLTFYKSGNYVDLCRGGHVENPKDELKYFKLLKIAGAYWRGNEKNKMLTRIYGTCFPSKAELDTYLYQLKETEKRDHRKLGQELDLFSINPLVGPGLILWHPKLARVRNVVEQFWKDEHYKEGYQLVFTPHISNMDMFVISRHLSKYIDFMFPIMLHEFIEGESAPDYHVEEVLKPMNCPGHVQIYKSRPRSYKELPIRIGELGTVHRYERAGVLHGMTRVRGFTQDDSHIFCRPDQVKDEVRKVLHLTKRFYDLFGFNDYHVYLSTRPEKFLGDLKMWEFSENSLREVLEEEKIPYKVDVGGGAFYGPKIDSKVKDSLGREWQLGTIQFDFNQPDKKATTEQEIEEFWNLKAFKYLFKTKEKTAKYLNKLGRGFDVTYINDKGQPERAVMIHRVIFGALERFFGILIEHYGGAFPTWLAPVQVQIIPIADRHLGYAQKVKEQLESKNVRVEVDERPEKMQAKIRDAQNQKVPYMLIMGDREEKENKVAIRVRNKGDIGQMGILEFRDIIVKEIESKSLELMDKQNQYPMTNSNEHQ